MTNTLGTEAAASAGPGPATAGRRLKAAREAAGLSVDAVAQQLKLAPRQVKALEDDDWSRLPGRTFVRGFARNYARFVRIDPDAVLALLPSADSTPSLERPPLAASRRPMGEMPVERVAKPSAMRWIISLLILIVVTAAALYELSKSQFRLPALTSLLDSGRSAAPGSSAASAPPQTPGTVTTALPNPVSESPASAPLPASGAKSDAPAEAATSPPAVAAIAPPVAAGSPGVAPAGDTGVAPAAEAALVLTFKGTSWAEVKDARGRAVLQMTGGPGMTQTVSAQPPLELALGNAPEVDVTFRGRALDLSPYTRGSVARVELR